MKLKKKVDKNAIHDDNEAIELNFPFLYLTTSMLFCLDN